MYEKLTIITLSNAGRSGDGEGRGAVGLKGLNPSSPHHLYGVGKTREGQSGEGRVKQGGAKLPSLQFIPLFYDKILVGVAKSLNIVFIKQI